ncbi:M48 family metalloprotease [Streptomyces sp. NPDC003943]
MSDHEDIPPPPYPVQDAPPPYPVQDARPPYPVQETPPPYPVQDARPPYPVQETPPPYPGQDAPPPYPGQDAPPPYPGDAAPPYPGEIPPAYPDEVSPARPRETPPPAYPGEGVPAPRSGDMSPPAPVAAHTPPVPPAARSAALPSPSLQPSVVPPPVATPAPALPSGVDHDDLALEQGRRMVKAVQRGVDGAALSHLLVTVPIGLISLSLVAFVSAAINPVLAVVVPALWLLSGPLIFHRKVESAIARFLFGMRRPTAEEARRLDVVWEQVTRRAGVDRETYELWIQERTELNATAAAGHVVAVTRHAMERLPNTRLAAVLAHELGHHVGGHPWAAMLADWYALPARAAGRAVLVLLYVLFRTKHWAGIACGGCLSLAILQFLFVFTFVDGMWWLVLPVAAGPLLIAWLHRRAEFRADAYAVGLGFGEALESVLVAEAEAAVVPGASPYGAAAVPPGVPPVPQQHPGQQHPGQQHAGQQHAGQPYAGQPYAGQAFPGQLQPAPPVPASGQPTSGGTLVAKAAHTNTEARLRNVRLVMSQQFRRHG